MLLICCLHAARCPPLVRWRRREAQVRARALTVTVVARPLSPERIKVGRGRLAAAWSVI